MSGFTAEVLEKKLNELNNSQQSIQTLSLWLIHHRKHLKLIVQTWYKELKRVKPSKRLTFMYLANDVIQNSRKKGPEYTKEFASALKHAFEFVAKDADEKMIQSLDRIINIWKDRNIYEQNLLDEFHKNLSKKDPQLLVNQAVEQARKRKESEQQQSSPSKKIKPVLLSQSEAELPVKGENVDCKELINCLKSLENTASSDAVVRERIAKLSPEISDVQYIDKLQDKNEADRLGQKVDEACQMLNDYNGRLIKELEDRKNISVKLAAYLRYQREAQEKAQKILSEFAERLTRIKRVKNELKLKLRNLPDLTKLQGALTEAPLPKPGDLFVSTRKEKEENEKSPNDQHESSSEEKSHEICKQKETDYELTKNGVAF